MSVEVLGPGAQTCHIHLTKPELGVNELRFGLLGTDTPGVPCAGDLSANLLLLLGIVLVRRLNQAIILCRCGCSPYSTTIGLLQYTPHVGILAWDDVCWFRSSPGFGWDDRHIPAFELVL